MATFFSISGLVISFVGSGWYSYIKLTEKKPAPVAAAAPAAAPQGTAVKAGAAEVVSSGRNSRNPTPLEDQEKMDAENAVLLSGSDRNPMTGARGARQRHSPTTVNV